MYSPYSTHDDDAPIAKLPMEILELIGTNLDCHDFFECILVSIAWNSIFQPFLYRSVTIDQISMCTRFIKTLEESTDTSNKRKMWYRANQVPRIVDNLGSYVLSLNISDGLMISTSLDKLTALCPNLESVSFRWENYFEKYMNYTPRTRAFRTPLEFFDRIHPSSLRTLTLKARSVSKLSRRPIDLLFVVLRHFPQLESLTVMDESLVLRIEDLEELHSRCPQLDYLCISDADMDLHDTTVPRNAITPVTTRHLSLLSDTIWRDASVFQGIWFQYLVQKYPALKTLSLHRPRPDLFYHRERPGRTNRESTPLVYHFPQLRAVCLDQFGGDLVSEWPTLVQDIQDITLYSNPIRRSLAWSGNHAPRNMTRLVLPWIPTNIDVLNEFTSLRELCFCSAVRLEYEFQMLKLDDLLSVCPVLEKLDIAQYIVSCTTTSPQHTSLRALVLDVVVIRERDTFADLASLCPRLSYVEVLGSHWSKDIISRQGRVSHADLAGHGFWHKKASQHSQYDIMQSTWY